MKATVTVLIAVILGGSPIFADGKTVLTTFRGDFCVTVDPTTGVVTVDHEPDEAPPRPVTPEIRIVDSSGGPVRGTIVQIDPRRTRFVPEIRPLPTQQYTVDVPDANVVSTFTRGPDVYPPGILRVDDEVVRAEGPMRIKFTEAIYPRRGTRLDCTLYELTQHGPVEVEARLGDLYRITEIAVRPAGMDSFSVGRTYRLVIEEEVSDEVGNTARLPDVEFTCTTDEFQSGGRSSYHYRVPEAVYWSNRTSFGIVNLSPRCAEPYDGGWLHRSSARGDPSEVVVDPRVDEDGHSAVYGIDPRGDRIVVFVTRTTRVHATPFAKPGGLAIHPGGRVLYVTNCKFDSLVAFDVAKPTAIAPILKRKLGAKPSNVAVSTDGAQVAVLFREEARVLVFDSGNLTKLHEFTTAPRPTDLTYVQGANGRQVLLTACRGRRLKGGSILVWDVATGTKAERLDGFASPARITAKGTRAWVAEEGARRVTAVDVGADGKVGRGPSVPAGPRPRDVAIGPNLPDQLFVVNRRKSRITVVSISTGEILSELAAKGALAVASLGEN